MAKQKAGLHKNISSIFDGVPLPNGNEGNGSPGAFIAGSNNNDRYSRGDLHSSVSATHKDVQPTTMQKPPELSSKISKLAVKSNKFNAKKGLFQGYLDKIKDKLLTPQPGVSPTKHMAMVILIPLLFVIMIFVFSKVLFKGSLNEANANEALSEMVPIKSDNESGWKVPEPYPANLRDPMKMGTISTSLAQTGQLVVTAIVYSKEKPSAVIGTEIAHEGDQIFGTKIIKINLDSVEFEKDDKRWTQKLQN